MKRMILETSKRVCFWGAPARIPPTLRLFDDCIQECGQNTGNLFIGNGLWQATRAPTKDYWNFYFGTPEEFDEKFDVLFVPSSNFIFEYTDLTDQYKFFSKTKAQIFMFGLGSQLRDIGNVRLPEGTEAFIRLAAERSGSIGVRGEITESVVRRMGISNVEVVGCPSMLEIPSSFSPVPDLNYPETVISGNFTNNAREHAFSSDVLLRIESSLFHELVKRQGYYVLQNERPEIKLQKILAYSETLSPEEIWYVQRVETLFQTAFSAEDLKAFLRWRSKIFFSTYEWVRFMKTIDFSFGTRFHGNVAAILAGRPCIVLCHDFRTLELCQLYKIPHKVVDAHAPPVSIAELAADSNMSHFLENYKNLQDIWESFARKNGLTPIIENS